MSEVFISTLSQMLVMLICMVIGFVLRKGALLPENAGAVMSKLENYIFVPALIIHTFMTYCTPKALGENYMLVLLCGGVLTVALCISLPLSAVFAKNDNYKRNIYKYALTFGNFSFMGNAIVPAILGESALYPYMMYLIPLNVAVYTWGVMILVPKGEKKKSILSSLLNPIFISILIGAALGLTGAVDFVPAFALKTIDYCKASMAPVAMILTGFVIGGYNIKELLTDKKIYIATALRLIVFPAIFLALLYFAGSLIGIHQELLRLALVLTLFAYATPLGLNTVVFPAAYGGDTKTGASMAMISHTLCVITIPIMYALLTGVLDKIM